MLSRVLFSVAFAVSACGDVLAAQVINIDGLTSDTGVTLTLEPGEYQVTFAAKGTPGAIYEAMNAFGGNVSGCDALGGNCTEGWRTNFDYEVSGDLYQFSPSGRWASADQALQAALSGPIYRSVNGSPYAVTAYPVLVSVLDATTEYRFFRSDSFTADNIGGISLIISTIPEPPAQAMLALGAVALALTRRLRGLRAKRASGEA